MMQTTQPLLPFLTQEPVEVPAPGESIPTRPQKLRNKWGTAYGQVWQVESNYKPGAFHRLTCADSRDVGALSRLTDGKNNIANVIITSPPYADQRSKAYPSVKEVDYANWFNDVQEAAKWMLAPDGSFFVNIKEHVRHGERATYVLETALAMVKLHGWKWIDTQAWVKASMPGNVGPRFRNDWEPIYHWSRTIAPKWRPDNVLVWGTDMKRTRSYKTGVHSVSLDEDYNGPKPGAPTIGLRAKDYRGGVKPSNVIEINKGFEKNAGHGAVFPLRLPIFFIRAFSDVGDVIYDPFGGSGTSTVAAELNGRIGYYADILPINLAVTLQRLADLGLRPEKVSG